MPWRNNCTETEYGSWTARPRLRDRKAAMDDGEKKSLVWVIKKDLLTPSADQLLQTAKSLRPVPEMDQCQLEWG